MGPRGVLVGEHFLTPESKRILLGLIADRLALAVALWVRVLYTTRASTPASTSAANAATTIKTIVLVAMSAP